MTSLTETRFRTDLVVAPVSGGAEGVRAVIVKDLKAGRSFRFDQREFFLCKNWNGTLTVDELLEAFHQRFGTRISPADFNAFLNGLSAEALLEPCPPAAMREGREKGKSQYVWSAELPAGAMFEMATLAHQFSWLGPVMVWASLPASILAIGTLLHNQRILAYDLGMLSRLPLSQILLMHFITMWGLQLFSILLQGLVLAYFGGRITKMGIRFECGFLPVLDATLADAERLSRREKLWVFGVPLLVRLLVTVGSVIVWFNSRLTGTSMNQLAIFMGTSGLLQLLTRGSPLWYNEGYLLLATYLRNPRLLPQSQLLWIMLVQRRSLPRALGPLRAMGLGSLGLVSFVFSAALLVFMVLIFSNKVGILLYGVLGRAGTPITLLIVCILFARFLLKTYSQFTKAIQ
jgi:hypothetical protein